MRCRQCSARARPSSGAGVERRSDGASGERRHQGRARAARARHAASSRTKASPMSIAPRCCTASGSALHALERLHRGRALRRGARARRALRAAVRRAPPQHPRLALAVLPAPARLRGCPRGRRARARARGGAPRRASARRRVLPGIAARRARRPLGARPHLRRAGEGAVRGARRPRERRPADEQPRRLEFLLGKPEKRSSTSSRPSRSRSSSAATRSGNGRLVAGAGSSPHRRRQTAEEQARQALEIIAERADMLDQIGNARLVLGRALLEQGRLDEAESRLRRVGGAFARFRRPRTGPPRGSPRAISRPSVATNGGRRCCTGAPPRLCRIQVLAKRGGVHLWQASSQRLFGGARSSWWRACRRGSRQQGSATPAPGTARFRFLIRALHVGCRGEPARALQLERG